MGGRNNARAVKSATVVIFEDPKRRIVRLLESLTINYDIPICGLCSRGLLRAFTDMLHLACWVAHGNKSDWQKSDILRNCFFGGSLKWVSWHVSGLIFVKVRWCANDWGQVGISVRNWETFLRTENINVTCIQHGCISKSWRVMLSLMKFILMPQTA